MDDLASRGLALDLEAQRMRCLLEADVVSLRGLCHENLEYCHSTGSVDSGEAFVEKVAKGFYVYRSIEWDVTRVRWIGDCLLLGERMNAVADVDGRNVEIYTQALVVWLRDAAGWRFASYHAAPSR